ncbi:peptidoglycan-associated lipoprotein Pal [Aeromonas simiae]|uniref:Peptidoglycan-associated lipoprotein n=1 Tax=Aeromonas simiae TaxID=218936 RepID=A0A5J6WUE5_9GAMM|nr:peptidoglycan-associated lipoprotein Pal [Aeromonas simiae]MDO2947459.1 peptidoglycan-associated lipoprotein Pal [Aeromonas simiae]MDO2951551.1 peptidoglycan-associated lipoprotein Pal [Aeromonas simiae]MDO2955019.1 peptidoglycan-associated lipoprotein Pal [Aeromonas simiae]QFI53874.1 peptidoglycan-associated lipoprotein Pal [Aeromonas simiae]
MQLNKLLKGLAIALPLFTLAACSSTSDSDASGAESGMGANGGVMTGSADGMLSPEEQMRQRLAALQRDNVIYFGFDSNEIQGQYADLLDTHSSYLRENPSVKVLIEGHTDERGTPEYNIALGERRAKAVAKYMQTLGVQADQLSIVSYGEEKPQDPGHGEDSYSKNRRAVLVY